MQIAFQMDAIENLSLATDTTLRIAEEGQKRGHTLWYYTPHCLCYSNGRVITRAQALDIQRQRQPNPIVLGTEHELDLAHCDVVWLRQDPPFNMHYITTTHILERIPPPTRVLNNPFWVRNCPEKMFALDFPEFIPPTTIASDLSILHAFRQQHGDIVIKPLHGNGGTGVIYLSASDPNLNPVYELFSELNYLPLIVQKFLPKVTEGDKRIILIDGYPVGAINRVPQNGEIRSNMHVGGQAKSTTLSERESQICRVLGNVLRERGQILVGIDVIDGYLTEINVTSPTGIQEIEYFDQINIAERLWQTIERNQPFASF